MTEAGSLIPSCISYRRAGWFLGLLAFLWIVFYAAWPVLVTLPWATETSSKGPFNFPSDDDLFMDKVFPFRKLPRELVLFGMLARNRGGITAFYRYGEQAVESMRRNRGWHFIDGQSHFAGNRLPDDFRLGTSQPDVIDDPLFFRAALSSRS